MFWAFLALSLFSIKRPTLLLCTRVVISVGLRIASLLACISVRGWDLVEQAVGIGLCECEVDNKTN